MALYHGLAEVEGHLMMSGKTRPLIAAAFRCGCDGGDNRDLRMPTAAIEFIEQHRDCATGRGGDLRRHATDAKKPQSVHDLSRRGRQLRGGVVVPPDNNWEMLCGSSVNLCLPEDRVSGVFWAGF